PSGDVLEAQGVACSTDVVDLCSVVLAKGMLDTEVPIDRVRILDVRRNPVGRSRQRFGPRQSCDAAASRAFQTAVSKEVRRKWDSLSRRADLRRNRQNTDVVVKGVPRHAEATANRGGTTGPR